jgi:hypothetical protein
VCGLRTFTGLRAMTGTTAIGTWVQLGSKMALTPAKTRQSRVPEDEASQQDREPSEICKTSIPGSSPGGASNPKLLQISHLQPTSVYPNFYPNFCP